MTSPILNFAMQTLVKAAKKTRKGARASARSQWDEMLAGMEDLPKDLTRVYDRPDEDTAGSEKWAAINNPNQELEMEEDEWF